MDAQGDGPYSRAPELEDLLTLCRALNSEGVRYCVIGGFAVILHGFARTTKDIDLLIDPDPRNVAAVKRAMANLPDNAVALMVPVASKEMLIRTKETGRESDFADVRFLRIRIEEDRHQRR